MIIYANALCADRIPDNKPLASPVSLGSLDTLRVTLTTQEGRSATRAHQVFLLLKDPHTGLDISYPFSVKDSGKSRLDLVSLDFRDTNAGLSSHHR